MERKEGACCETVLTLILELVKSECLFGMVLCDIMVPEELKDYFSEMTPIFNNIKISQEDVGEPMRVCHSQQVDAINNDNLWKLHWQ